MTKTHYPIPSGCTGVTIEQEGEVVIVKFETEPKVERMEKEERFYYIAFGNVEWAFEDYGEFCSKRYDSGNYFRTRDEAEDKLDRIG
jgi:hypothetical protein